MIKMTIGLICLLATVSSSFLGCAPKVEEEDLPSVDAGVPFTASDIVKAWTSSCLSKIDATLGTTQSKIYLTLNSNGSFSFQEYMYSPPSHGVGCSNVDYITVFMVSGTYSVGATRSGGQLVSFATSTSRTLMVTGNNHSNTQDIFNTDCGGTSPYCALSGASCTNNGVASGAGQNSSSMLCQHYTFPNSSSVIQNVASWDGSALSIGAQTTGVPGVFNSGSVASSATINLQ